MKHLNIIEMLGLGQRVGNVLPALRGASRTEKENMLGATRCMVNCHYYGSG
jgi:hypothetical protein